MNNGGSDNVYLNVSVTNPNPNVNSSVQAVYNVAYDQSILEKPSDYYMAITAFQIPLGELPLFIMPFIPPNIYESQATQAGNVLSADNLFFTAGMVGGNITYNGQIGTVTGYIDQNNITISFAGVVTILTTFTITYGNLNPNKTPYIIGVCQQQNASIPPAVPPNGTPVPLAPNYPVNITYWTEIQDLAGYPNNPLYYYVYDYTHYVDMLNYALQQSFILAGSPGGATNFPYFIYNSSQGLIQCIMPTAFVAAAPVGFHWTVFFNYQCFYNTLSFYTVENNGRIEIWNAQTAYDKSLLAPSQFGSAYLFSEEYATIDYLNSVRKIVVTSSTIPVQKEYYPQPGNVNLGTTNAFGILSDFNLNLLTPGSQRSVALYSPTIYKLIDLVSDSPMRKVDIAFWWVDRLNNFYPIYIDPFDSITMKIGFFSKRLYRSQALKYL
jgi:hypothetical protein